MFSHLNSAYWILRVAFGLGPLLAGLDKFTNLLVNWERYLNPRVLDFVPVSATTFMQLVGVIEIVAGAAILAGATRSFGYIVMFWLLGIAGNLVSTGQYFDIAVRDVLLACGAYALVQVTEARRRSLIVTETDIDVETDRRLRAA
jgi:uncharacterized membrane protein YphA (DoxX/SURF4 family)